MATDLGLVGIANKGPYDSTVTYYQGNFVYYNSSTWLLKAVSATGSEPTENNTDWQLLAKGIIPTAFTGATSSANGTMGQVPAPLIADVGKFLNADGSWKNVPNPQTMTGATSQTAGTGGLTPTPSAGDQDKFLAGDGTYKQDERVGTLSSLTTNEKNTLVGAINEVDGNADAANTAIGTLSSLNTTEKNSVVGAINEVDSHTDTNTANIGTLANLTTTAKTDLVAAINEVDSHADANATAIVNGIQNAIEVTTPTFSALPVTFTVQGMTADHKLIQEGSAFVSNPSAQLDQWTLTTGANTLTISGTISGSTYIIASFGIKRNVTATSS